MCVCACVRLCALVCAYAWTVIGMSTVFRRNVEKISLPALAVEEISSVVGSSIMPKLKCCICGTFSSRDFRPSAAFESRFERVFGSEAKGKSGKLCGACRVRCQRALPNSSGSSTSSSPFFVDVRTGQTGARKRRCVFIDREDAVSAKVA